MLLDIAMLASKVMELGGQADFVVMGAGVAGLRAAVELARHGEVLVVTKESVAESNTHYAQGGIAVAMEGRQDVALHLKDTIAAGDGLVYRQAAEVLVAEGPQRVGELIEWGARFDRDSVREPTGSPVVMKVSTIAVRTSRSRLPILGSEGILFEQDLQGLRRAEFSAK